MSVKKRIEERLAEIDDDNRIHYEPADVRVNAPLALIQTRLSAQKAELEWVLSLLDGDETPDTMDTDSDQEAA